ncbi:MAG: hypothetical protein B7Z39_02100 [Novosphingobium sp. 12-64-8]|nr:MAG: hypothetical protein B7Z39_02100 [Novosphingobium sp. 12-64-8]
MKNLNMLKATVAPAALGLAMLATPGFAQEVPQTTAAAEEAPTVIVVTGSRIASPNLDSISPVTVVSAADVKATGTTRIEDLVNSLPQVFAGQGSNISNGSTGTATLDLRGLGSDRTLVLINGRRVIPGDPSSSAADINIIPASMIKRVDVLTGGASAVYGADAVAGVVNFVLDTQFEGFRLDGQYSLYNHRNRAGVGVTQELDRRNFAYPRGSSTNGGTVDATLSFGAGFDDGHGHVTAYVGYRKTNPVLQSSRDYSSCVLGAQTTAQVAASPNRPYNCGGSFTGARGNFIAYNSFGDSTDLLGGGADGKSPDGIADSLTSTVYSLGAGRSFENAADAPYNFGPLNYFQRPDERYTAGLFADYEISEAIHPYMEFMFMDDRTVAQIAPSGNFGSTLSINCDNPLLSAQQKAIVCSSENLLVSASPLRAFDVVANSPGETAFNFTDPSTGAQYNRGFLQTFRRNVEGGPRQDDLQHTNYRAVIGTKGRLGKAWNYDAYYQYGRTIFSETYFNDTSISRMTKALDVVTGPNGQPVCRSVLDGSDPNCKVWDIFGGTVSKDAISYYSVPAFQRGINTEQVASAYLSGSLGEYGIKSPFANDGLGLVVGAEYRKETLNFQPDVLYQTADLSGQGAKILPVQGDYHVTEFFGELRIPLVQDSFIYDASITGGYRNSKYVLSTKNSFTTNTYKIEGEISPVRDIRFRAGYNRAVRIPTLQDLFKPNAIQLDGSTDPCAGFAITPDDVGCLAQGLSVGQTVAENPAGQYNGFLGGNPGLSPEVADTITAGAVFTPTFIPGLSISVDYFNIKIKGAIQGYGTDTILKQCTDTADPTFCSLVHRDASGSLWRTSDGFTINPTRNIGGVKTSGIDVNLGYNREVGAGRATISFVGTYLDKLITDNGLSPAYNCAGLHGVLCGTPNPKWRHQMRVGYEAKNGLGASVRWRFFQHVTQDGSSSQPALTGDTQPANLRMPDVSYFDLALTARVGDHYAFRIGANNFFDKQPPLVGNPVCGGDSRCNGNVWAQVYDSVGRYIYAGVTLDF